MEKSHNVQRQSPGKSPGPPQQSAAIPNVGAFHHAFGYGGQQGGGYGGQQEAPHLQRLVAMGASSYTYTKFWIAVIQFFVWFSAFGTSVAFTSGAVSCGAKGMLDGAAVVAALSGAVDGL